MKNKMKSVAEWKKLVEEYQQPNFNRATWQLVNTLGPLALIWVALYFLKDSPLWISALLAVVAGLFLVRVFIIFHDCGHGSFFKSKKANDGSVCMVFIK